LFASRSAGHPSSCSSAKAGLLAPPPADDDVPEDDEGNPKIDDIIFRRYPDREFKK
jgi:hypothetical protein